MSVLASGFVETILVLFFSPVQRFFVLDNGILKYSKSPIDVSNLDCDLRAEIERNNLTSARRDT